jgi:MYXO-CTERM domain-containing protein
MVRRRVLAISVNFEMLKRRFAFTSCARSLALFMQPRFSLIVAATLLGSALGCVGPAPEKLGRAQQGLDICAVSPEGALCDDNKACTISDRCVGSVCVGTVAPNGTPCTDGDVCTINDVCMAGLCMGTVAPDDNPCTDGDPCTQPDMCKAGKCQAGPPRICNDGNICTTDMCIATVGCMAVPIPECVVPVDAADASPDQDSGPDVVMPDSSPVDMVDMAPPIEVGPPIDMSIDMSMPETTDLGPAEAAVDAMDAADGEITEVALDVSDDLPAEVGDDVPGDSPVDASADVTPADAGADASEDMGEPPPDLRARGGACVCTAGDGPEAPGYLLAGLLVATAGWRRRRR